MAEAQQAFNGAERSGVGVDRARAIRAEAWEDRGRALGAIADTVRIGRPHVLAADHGRDDYRSPLAERLADDIAAQGNAHLLVRAGLAADGASLAAAVAAVSVAIGRTGYELAWHRVPAGGGIVLSEIWLDTAKTPDEIAAES